MQQGLPEAGRAICVDAADRCFAFLAYNVSTAYGTTSRHAKRSTVFTRLDDTDDFGDYVTAAFDQDGVANSDPKTFNLILVVKRGPRDCNAAYHDWLKMGNWS